MIGYGIKGFAESTATEIENRTLYLFNGDRYLQFNYEVANATIAMSHDRRMSAGHTGLLEASLHRVIVRRDSSYKDPQPYSCYLKTGFMSAIDYFRPVVLHRLREEQAELFHSSYFITINEPSSHTVEHPMRTFGRYLDELEHVKDVDKELYKSEFNRKRTVTALYRVGLACLPPDSWQAHIRLHRLPEGASCGHTEAPEFQ